MKNQGTLAVLLLLAGGLIYSAAQYPRDTVQSQRRGADAAVRTAAWHGPSRGTPRFAAETLDARVERLLEKAMRDVTAYQDTARFVCKLPAEVGPVPLLDAVDAYLRGLPGSRGDPAMLRDLHRAARHGNWLAKVQVYLSRDGQQAPDDAMPFRTISLLEWMQEHHIGALYAAIGDAAGVSHPRRARVDKALSSIDLYAAMHHNYPSQYKVGRELLRSGDARQAAVGRRMLDCAARALPVYRQMVGESTQGVRG
ncbi:hypothetical protein OU994_28510 [Pseudoduganella sp. SL102]|uniref:hypothetical protein n=1 Tax=Pseudoduganella sp. SL102 TaxID=2995154 RepID=UPI00248C0FA9|nr:hypothetical protein [Pseudoduganella sp. SL102]WBS02150.1 hypothetical protein OU994_28510 [Pseudoduganella sp. SL102]